MWTARRRWVSGHGVSGGVRFSWEVRYIEAPREGPLLQTKEPWICDLIQCAITKDLGQGLVVGDYDQVVTAMCEVFRLLKAPGHSQSFAFNSGVSLFSSCQETRTSQSDAPSARAPAGRLAGHLQCFWKRKYPIPRLDQSRRRHVGRDMSKISTPLRMASMLPLWRLGMCPLVRQSIRTCIEDWGMT